MAQELEDIWQGDHLPIAVAVEDDDGNPVDITGATIEAGARLRDSYVAASDVSITDGAGGVCRVSWEKGVLSAEGIWTIQVRVARGAAVDTILEARQRVRRSILPAP